MSINKPKKTWKKMFLICERGWRSEQRQWEARKKKSLKLVYTIQHDTARQQPDTTPQNILLRGSSSVTRNRPLGFPKWLANVAKYRIIQTGSFRSKFWGILASNFKIRAPPKLDMTAAKSIEDMTSQPRFTISKFEGKENEARALFASVWNIT